MRLVCLPVRVKYRKLFVKTGQMVKMVDCHKQFSFHKWKIETSEEKYWNETN